MDHRVDDHPAPHDAGPRRRQLHDIRRETDARAEHRPLDDGSGEAPERGAASERQRETQVDAEQHREPGEHTADERPPAGAGIGGVGAEEVARVQQRGQRAQRERGAARPRDGDELERRHHEHHVEQHGRDGHPPAPPAHEHPRAERHADELDEPGQPFDQEVRAEDLVDRGEYPQAPGPVEVQEVLVRYRAVEHPVGEDEHEALFHRRARRVQQRAQRQQVRDHGDGGDDPPGRGGEHRRRRCRVGRRRIGLHGGVIAHEHRTVTGPSCTRR